MFSYSFKANMLTTALLLSCSANLYANSHNANQHTNNHDQQSVSTAKTVSSEGLALAKELIKIDGSQAAIENANKVGIEQMKQAMPDAPKGFFTKLTQNVQAHDYATEMAVLYAQYFTVSELKALIAFYQSPVGASIAHKTGKLTEVVAIKQQQTAEKIFNKTLEEFGVPPIVMQTPD